MTAEQSNRAKSRQDTKEATGGGGGWLEKQAEPMPFWSVHAASWSKYGPPRKDI